MHVRVLHTAQLDPAELEASRRLVCAAFDGDVEPQDWEHALGGLHVLAVEDDAPAALVGHAAVVGRRLLHDGRTLRCGYVEAVAVRGDRRRRGIGRALVAEVERIVHRGFELGALGTTDEGRRLYEARGWRAWRGPLGTLSPDGPRATPEDVGAVLVLPGTAELDLDGELACDWRDGDVW